MGASTARITAADFVTPPEFDGYPLAAEGAGRIGGVRLELVSDGAHTRLGRCYQQVPLRLLPPFRFGPEQPTLLYLLNPTAGLLDGDAQLVRLSAGPGTRTLVVGQSATRIHPSWRGYCTQQWQIDVDAGAVLIVLPGPAIPFPGCRYYQHVTIDLAADAGLVWGDIWLAGRYARGQISEQFCFDTIVQELTVRRHGRLAYRDRFCWRGPWDRATAAWHFGGELACGSMFVAGLGNQALPVSGCVRLATTAGDTCLRWLGTSESVTGGLVNAALQAAAHIAGRTPECPWLLGTNALGPNHWFLRAAHGSPANA
jgi:urease accessory protein